MKIVLKISIIINAICLIILPIASVFIKYEDVDYVNSILDPFLTLLLILSPLAFLVLMSNAMYVYIKYFKYRTFKKNLLLFIFLMCWPIGIFYFYFKNEE